MPALDSCHPQVVRALEKAGWSVSPKPVVLQVEDDYVFVDILAQRVSEDGTQEIAIIEVKCFPDANAEKDHLYTAIGQYLVYRSLLREAGLADIIYLAIPVTAYHGIFKKMALPVATEVNLQLIIVELDDEEIIEWIVMS